VSFARAGKATVRVLDVSGRKVRTLLEGPVEAGERGLSWDGRRDDRATCASGIYWVEVEQGTQKTQKRIGLMR
jgi:flagellar hook assembly protein FlgD